MMMKTGKKKASQTVKEQIQTSDVQAVTTISDSGFIPKQMAKSLSARGLVQFGEKDELMAELAYPAMDDLTYPAVEALKAFPVQIATGHQDAENRINILRSILDLFGISPLWSERDMLDQIRRRIYPPCVGGWSCSTQQLIQIREALQRSNGEVNPEVQYRFLVTLLIEMESSISSSTNNGRICTPQGV